MIAKVSNPPMVRVPERDHGPSSAWCMMLEAEVVFESGLHNKAACKTCWDAGVIGVEDYRSVGVSEFAWFVISAWYRAANLTPPMKVVPCPSCTGFEVSRLEDAILAVVRKSIEAAAHE